MLFEDEMCGKGLMCQWRGYTSSNDCNDSQSLKIEDNPRRGDRKRSWHKCARKTHRWRKRSKSLGYHVPCGRHNRSGTRLSGTMSLRPVNNQGNRAPGMRAPRNTNQFLMHEKYQMMHMRSDSVGTDSGSDCEMDFADMDSYLRMLENARGGLMDSPDPLSPSARFCPQLARRQHFPFFSLSEVHQEESMQYFPSEDDVMQSEDFMQKDFIAFCNGIAPVTSFAI